MERTKAVVSKAVVSKKEHREGLPLTFLTANRLDGFQIESSDSNKKGMEIDTWTPWETSDTI